MFDHLRVIAARVWKWILIFLDIIGLVENRKIDQESQLARFRHYHADFRNLLTANNNFLETLVELEQKKLAWACFDHFYVENTLLRTTVFIHQMVENLNSISGERYPQLRKVHTRLCNSLTSVIGRFKQIDPSELIRDLQTIDGTQVGLVGGKIANLGEIRAGTGLPVPDGFAVTTEAYRLFIQETGLQQLIKSTLSGIENSSEVDEISSQLMRTMSSTALPELLSKAILAAYDQLAGRCGEPLPRVAVRSSALGEDSQLSFAGQFLTLLNVDRSGLLDAYRQVVVSLFSTEAIHYRLLHHLENHYATMAVGVIAMVNAQASGVGLTRDPALHPADDVVIHAVRGLGVTLVSGQATPEMIRIARTPSLKVIERKSSRQGFSVIVLPGGSTGEQELTAADSARQFIGDSIALELAAWAIKLEQHFGAPQEIEWAIDAHDQLMLLQSRPVHLPEPEVNRTVVIPENMRILLDSGDIACPGVGCGPAVIMDESGDLESFPAGAVLVAPRSSPRFISLMNRAQAIVTDAGSITGHMASLAREFRIPSLLNTVDATRTIPAGMVISVDASHHRIYAGELPLECRPDAAVRPTAGFGECVTRTPAFRMLEEAAEFVIPLHLIDTRSNQFSPEQCTTLHDIARFIHEKAYTEMFNMGDRLGDLRGVSYSLDVFLPIDLYIIDLGKGIADTAAGNRKVKPSQVISVPLKAIINGMLDRRLQQFGPKPMDARGFMSIMVRHAMTSPEQERTFRDPSYALISDHYLNYTARVGYHFGVVDSYCGKTPNKNYINILFRGGAADYVRRCRRVKAIAGILQAQGFANHINGDAISGRFNRATQEETAGRLEMIGRLLQFARQLDVAMVSDDSIGRVQDAFLSGSYKLDTHGNGGDQDKRKE